MQAIRNLIGPVISLILLCACTQEINSGKFHGLKIGMRKDEVLAVLKTNERLTHIQPTIYVALIIDSGTSSKEEKLTKILQTETTLIVSHKYQLKLGVIFDNSVVSNKSFGLFRNELGIEAGMTRLQVKEIILKGFLNGSVDRVYPYLADSDWRELDKLSYEEFYKYDHWGFHGISDYSYTRLHFENETLKLITHAWTPVELP